VAFCGRGRTADAAPPFIKTGNAKLFHVEHRTHDRRNTVQIVDLNTEEMVDICVRLVREGVTFRASPMGYGTWMIVFTGGY